MEGGGILAISRSKVDQVSPEVFVGNLMSHELLLRRGQAKDIIVKGGSDLDVVLLAVEGAV